MEKTLWLLRHATALDDPPAGGRDRDRRLAPKGEAEAIRLGEAVAAGDLGTPPSIVLVSAAARTRRTAELAFAGAEGTRLIEDARLYRADPDDLLAILAELPDEHEVVGVVGHNPTIHCCALDLVAESADHPAASSYPPASLAVVALPLAHWSQACFGEGRLLDFVAPS